MNPVTYLSVLSVLIPIFTWLICVRSAGLSLYFILISVLLSGIFDGLQYYYAVKSGNNTIISNLYPLGGLLTLSLAYYVHRDFTGPMRKLVGATALAGLSTILVFMFIHKLDEKVLFINMVIQSVVFILLSLYYFIHKIFYTGEFEILKHPFFYISCAVFIYNLSCVTVFSAYYLVLDSGFQLLWSIKLISYILYNLMLAYSFIIFRKHKNLL